MKLRDLETARKLSEELDQLREKREMVSNNKGVMVSIQSIYQDDVLVRAALPGIIQELDRRIRDNISQLKALGIEL